jgi:hypothetical protein
MCTCTKDSEITCIVHPHDYEKVRILAAENAKLKEELERYRLLTHDTQAHELASATLNRTGLIQEDK